MLVDEAADMRDWGYSMEETAQWVMENRKKVHHQFFSTDMKYYRRSGRVSGSAATLGAILSICPIMRLDDGGHIIVDMIPSDYVKMNRTTAIGDRVRLDLSKVLTEK